MFLRVLVLRADIAICIIAPRVDAAAFLWIGTMGHFVIRYTDLTWGGSPMPLRGYFREPAVSTPGWAIRVVRYVTDVAAAIS